MRWSEGCGSDIDIGDERTFAMNVWGYTEDDFDDEEEEYETSYSDVAVDDDSDPEVTEIGEPETVNSGLSIFDLI